MSAWWLVLDLQAYFHCLDGFIQFYLTILVQVLLSIRLSYINKPTLDMSVGTDTSSKHAISLAFSLLPSACLIVKLKIHYNDEFFQKSILLWCDHVHCILYLFSLGGLAFISDLSKFLQIFWLLCLSLQLFWKTCTRGLANITGWFSVVWDAQCTLHKGWLRTFQPNFSSLYISNASIWTTLLKSSSM